MAESKTTKARTVTVDPDLPTENSWIQATGVLWRRDWVHWKGMPKILGVAPSGSRQVDFCDERGLYVLYDGARPVYVGRSIDRPLGARLMEHTTDRLGARWDRFSCFGLRAVTDDGSLADPPGASCTSDIFIGDLEAVLIEALEPPLNRRRGDDIEAKEFRQFRDDSMEKQRMVKEFEEFVKSQRSQG